MTTIHIHLKVRDAGEFKESEHPRAANGQFGAGGGSGGSAAPKTSPAEKTAALTEYTGGAYKSDVGGYANLQSVLRTGKPTYPSLWHEEKGQKHLAALREAFAEASLPKPMTIYRGVRVEKGKLDELLNAKPGTVLQDKGVTSASTSREVVEKKFSAPLNRSDRIVKLAIDVPQGAKALHVGGHEKELALWRPIRSSRS